MLRTVRHFVTALLFACTTSVVASVCSDAGILGSNITKNVCWGCIFPIKVAGVALGDGHAPQGSAKEALCICEDRNGVPQFGVVTGKWNTAKLVELTPKAFCSPVMGGVKLQDSWKKFGGQPYTPQGKTGESTTSYYNYHAFAFDLFRMLELYSKFRCKNNYEMGLDDFDLAYMSEYDPSWNDEALAMLAFPESALFSNPIAQLAQIPDCFTSSIGKPIDSFFWTAGCWGQLYPIGGNAVSTRHPAMEVNLLAARALTLEHRRFFAHRTVGKDILCKTRVFPHLKKSQYKFQLMFPSPEAESIGGAVTSTAGKGAEEEEPGDPNAVEEETDYNTPDAAEEGEMTSENPGDGDDSGWGQQEKCCHSIGETTFRWGEHRERPNKNDWVVLIWNWIDCCAVY